MCGYNYTRKHTAEVAANWLKNLKRTTTFLWRPRKVRTSDGWVWGGSWAIVSMVAQGCVIAAELLAGFFG